MRKSIPVLWIVSVAAAVGLFACALWFGDLNQDEGWYLYAGRMVAEGKLPFIDFATTQGPLMSLVYGCAWPLVAKWGVAGGRLFTALLGAGCVAAAACLAGRLVRTRNGERVASGEWRVAGEGGMGNAELGTRNGERVASGEWRVAGEGGMGNAELGTRNGERVASGEWRVAGEQGTRDGERGLAALLCFLFVGLNVYQAYFFTVVKTYSLAGLLLVLGFLALTWVGSARGRFAALAGGAALVLAAGVRVSAAVAAPVVFGVLACSGSVPRKAKWWFLAGAVAAGCAVFLPFAVKAPVAFRFGLLEYHAGREAGGLLPALAYKAGFAARVIRAYFVPLAALAVVLAGSAYGRRANGGAASPARPGAIRRLRSALHHSPFTAALWLTVAAMTLVHAGAAFPYDDYQVMVFPLFAAALAAALVAVPAAAPEPGVRGCKSARLAWLFFCLNAAAALASPMVQDWFVGPRDRIWWPLKTRTPLQRLREGAALVRSLAGPDGLLLTQDAYLAVESGLKVPQGLELGPFSYFPGWPRAKAEACRVLDGERMRELLRTTDASVAAFSQWGLAIAAPGVTPLPAAERDELWQLVNRRYRLQSELEPFGQADTRLQVMVQRVPDW